MEERSGNAGLTAPADFERARDVVARIRKAIALRLVGKRDIVDGILTAVMSDGHVLLEGVPGLAKTLAVRTFAAAADLSYRRIQFTPDLLPGDITGTLFYEAAGGRFVPREGPVFANIVLADEINRAPAKVQSALLEAMEERQVTMGDKTLALPKPFFVLATQNPIEHEGTFRLPEAQLDRFMLKLLADYPDETEELQVVLENADRTPWDESGRTGTSHVLDVGDLDTLKAAARAVRFAKDAVAYAVSLVRATRPHDDTVAPQAVREVRRYIEYGASPRASIALYRAARAGALLDGRDYVLPDDVKRAAPAVLRHRIVPSYEAEAERISAETIVRGILSAVAVP
ncbi:MAG: MoxR family ATPase [Spirochaetales bacterium]|nr:MAG: MoxR family ATPase [Spirochaetales bacterium]